MKIRCLSVRQPYASALMTGQKVREYRTWPTRHRGALLIHAAKGKAWEEGFDDFPNFDPDQVPYGVLLGIVDVVGCTLEPGGNYAWGVRKPRWLPQALPWRGYPGLFLVELPDSLAAALAVQIADVPTH